MGGDIDWEEGKTVVGGRFRLGGGENGSLGGDIDWEEGKKVVWGEI